MKHEITEPFALTDLPPRLTEEAREHAIDEACRAMVYAAAARQRIEAFDRMRFLIAGRT